MYTRKISRAVKLVDQIKTLPYDNIVIIECGTLREPSERYHTGDGHSTRYICKFIEEQTQFKFISYISVDLDIKACDNYLKTLGLRHYVELVQEDSLSYLSSFKGKAHFIHLDTANDADLSMKEFLLSEKIIAKNGIIVVDDACLNEPQFRKGDKVIPYAQEKGYKVILEERQAIIKC